MGVIIVAVVSFVIVLAIAVALLLDIPKQIAYIKKLKADLYQERRTVQQLSQEILQATEDKKEAKDEQIQEG